MTRDTDNGAWNYAYLPAVPAAQSLQAGDTIDQLTNAVLTGHLPAAPEPGGGGTLDTSTHFVCYDHNGNVEKLITPSGAIVAEYTYDPFGNVISEISDLEISNPFRFSTKYHDTETGLVYYGYRYYSPELGRWPNRDPIGEQGGLDLYGFVHNEPIGSWDHLGLEPSIAAGLLVGPGPIDFWGEQNAKHPWTREQRDLWFAEFKRRYGEDIDDAAEANCIPRRLLAGIIINERIDHGPIEALLEGLPIYYEMSSRGVAQVLVKWARDEGFRGRDLQDPVKNIGIAAQVLKKFLDQTCAAGAGGQFKTGFRREIAGSAFDVRSPLYGQWCCSSCDEISDIQMDGRWLATMIAVWNSSPGVWEYESFYGNRKAKAAWNAYEHQTEAPRIAQYLNQWW